MKIEIMNLSYSYDGKKNVLENVNLCFEGGACYILTGKNGVGKTTLSKLIMRLLKPVKRTVFIDGADVCSLRTGKIAQRIGYVFQDANLQFFSNTVEEELSFPYKLTKKYDEVAQWKINGALEEFGLSGLAGRHPLTLSSGEKQRLALAAAMLSEPEFLILDEPAASVDRDGREFIANRIKEFVGKGGGALVISHDETFFEGVKIEI